MKLGIMQPYFLPYIGYFQLIAAAEVFVVYDNIKYTKRGWINRNRMLRNGSAAIFSLPLKKDSDTLDIVQRELAIDFDRNKLLNQIRGAYSCAPNFSQTFPLIEQIVSFDDTNLFRYIHNSIVNVCQHLGIDTEIRISSEIPIDQSLKGQNKVLALCEFTGADNYVNTIGGITLYDSKIFSTYGINLDFIQPKPIEYSQLGSPFVPWLSILDVLMFNSIGKSREYLRQFVLISSVRKNA